MPGLMRAFHVTRSIKIPFAFILVIFDYSVVALWLSTLRKFDAQELHVIWLLERNGQLVETEGDICGCFRRNFEFRW